ncbi:IMPACT family protein [Dokdonella sp.]|uniref:IMPACT family protein n=1 Tax=Dokdonella sp. TaxID=2291710 RepID=UPI003C470E1D
MTTLHALVAEARLEQEIRKSRFLALAIPVDDPAKALAAIAESSDPLATHNCWAYRIGQAYRFSDDGEPGGTAGRPILQAIEGQGFDQVAVVVTRWYGGIKLGAGGLARAYGGCAAECLRQAPRSEIVDTVVGRLKLEFSLLPILNARLQDFGADKTDEAFDVDGVLLELRMPTAQASKFGNFVQDLSRGKAVLTVDES